MRKAARMMYLGDDRLRLPSVVMSLAPYNGPSEMVLRDRTSAPG